MTGTPHSFKIGDLSIQPPLALAPMSEYTHAAYRQLLASFGGCGLYSSEMISARKAIIERGWQRPLFRWASDQRPFFFQLMGSEAETIRDAMLMLSDLVDEQGQGPAGFDINMGCGAYWLTREGSGVCLMKDIEAARRIVRLCRAATSLPLTTKIRIGWSLDPDHLIRFATMLEAEGVDAVTLHPRLAKERFTNRARWEYITLLKEKLSVPVIGNGDVSSIDDLQRMFAQTGCDGVMIGRAAITKPWLFQQFEQSQSAEADPVRVMNQMLTNLQHHFADEKVVLVRFKQFMKFFAGNFMFGHQLYWKIYHGTCLKDITRIIEENAWTPGGT